MHLTFSLFTPLTDSHTKSPGRRSVGRVDRIDAFRGARASMGYDARAAHDDARRDRELDARRARARDDPSDDPSDDGARDGDARRGERDARDARDGGDRTGTNDDDDDGDGGGGDARTRTRTRTRTRGDDDGGVVERVDGENREWDASDAE
jgi:hypothetical protein